MECQFDYCIYNKEFICTLKEIRINSLGMCEECEMVGIPSEVLDAYKNLSIKIDNPT